jgi:hypothetical protein
MVSINSKNFLKIFLLCSLALVILLTSAIYLPEGIDWRDTYRPAAQALLAGHSPFSVDIYFAAPWVLLPLLPIALLPVNIGRGVLFLIGMIAYAYTAYKLGATIVTLVVFLLSPPVVHGLLNSNIEWLSLLGFVMPAQIGLFFILIKPQIGFAVAIYWLIEAWRSGGIREVLRVFLPVTIALLVSFAIFGFWPARFQDTLNLTRSYNASLWPGSIPVGIALLVAAIHRRKIRFAMGASPCLSPYVLLHAWSGALVALVNQQVEFIGAVVGLWILVNYIALMSGF